MLKRITTILAVSLLTISLTACGNSEQKKAAQGVIKKQQADTQEQSANESNTTDQTQNTTESNILIAYFTVPETDGVDTMSSASRVATDEGVLGNTEFIATEIQKNLGGDLFAIETTQEYPGTHDDLLDFAYNEKAEDARPELATHIENLDRYDYIIIGYPNWNADLPMPLYSFFDEYNFSGKTIIPFVTHGGSGFSATIRTIQQLEPDATVVDDGLSISRNSVENAQEDVKTWTDSLMAD